MIKHRSAVKRLGFWQGVVLILCLAGCPKENSTLVADSSWADRTFQEKGVGLVRPSNKSGGDAADRVDSYREAKSDLYRKLENDILNLSIDPKRTVRTYVGDNIKLKEKIANFLKGTRITDAVYTPQKGMELSGELYLGGSFKSILGLTEKKPTEEKPKSGGSPSPSTGSGF